MESTQLAFQRSMGMAERTVNECNSDAERIFFKHLTGQMFRVNALLVVNAILMGVMVGIGTYGHRYRHHPLTRYIFLGATALFIPIISYVLSNIGNQNGIVLFADGLEILGLCDPVAHMNLVLIWTGLVQMVGISTTLVVVSDPREGRNIGPSVALLVQAMWTSYLMVYNIGLIYDVSPIRGSYDGEAYTKWYLTNVFSLVGLMIMQPFALTFAKLLFKCFAWYKARKSLAIGCNPRLIVGYMANDCLDMPPKLIVMGEDTLSVDKQPHGYNFAPMPNRSALVTLDKVWQLDELHDLKLTAQLKDVCLSFALSKLLRCRFARCTNAEIGFTKASNFLRHMLLQDSDDERILRLIEYELSFLHDVYYSSLAISYSKSWMPILSILISLSSIGYCSVLTLVIVWRLCRDSEYLEDPSYGGLPLLQCNYLCRRFEGEQQGTEPQVHGYYFGSPIFDLVPIVVLAALVVLAEIREVASYICSNWTKVALICRYINHPSWQKSRIMQKCIRGVLQCRCKILNHLEDKMNQCSILVLHLRKTPMGLLRRLKPGQKVKVPREVKAAIMNALRSYERSRDNIRMPSLRMRSQETGGNLFWVFDGTKGIANTILVCHIATTILELRSAGSCQPLSDHKTAAIHLSRYCAYLVAYSPELLPEDDEWCKSLYKTVKKNAERILAGVPRPEVQYRRLLNLMSETQNHEVIKDGAKLGQQLAKLNQGEAGQQLAELNQGEAGQQMAELNQEEANKAWEALACFWSEMMLYIAPSDNIDGHSEAIARGGELITLVWALLAHLGIFNRAGDLAGTTGEGATRRAESTREFTLINQCKAELWPAATPGESFGGGGYALRPGESVVFTAPVGWSGRVWGRTGCAFDSAGNGTCETGGCGTSMQCASASGAAPATLAEFTLASTDYYDVSLVDGFNLPMVVTPTPTSANWTGCAPAGCDGDLRRGCPSELAVKGDGGKVVACRSACDVFGIDQYCCRGQYANPVACQPTFYSKKFKAACPAAYSYAYDDPSSIFTCAQSPDYTITFCSSNMKQSVRSYRDSRLVCSGSHKSTSALMHVMLLLLLSSFLALQFATPL